MGIRSSKESNGKTAVAVADLLPDDVDAGERDGLFLSKSVMNFEWSDTICPVREMDPHFRGPTVRSPAKLSLGHGSVLGSAALPTGEQRKYQPADGSVTLSLANTGQVSLYGPTGERLCILKKRIETRLLKAGTAPWEVYTLDGSGPEITFAGKSYRKTGNIAFDKGTETFTYSENTSTRYIARGTFSKLKDTNPLFNADGAATRTSIATLKVHDPKSNTLIAIFSGAMKGPKHVRIAKNADVASLLCFSLAACFWWDDNKVAQINVGAAVALYALGAG